MVTEVENKQVKQSNHDQCPEANRRGWWGRPGGCEAIRGVVCEVFPQEVAFKLIYMKRSRNHPWISLGVEGARQREAPGQKSQSCESSEVGRLLRPVWLVDSVSQTPGYRYSREIHDDVSTLWYLWHLWCFLLTSLPLFMYLGKLFLLSKVPE